MTKNEKMIINTSDLSGSALSWAVARSIGELVDLRNNDVFYPNAQFGAEGVFCPQNSWDQAGPIIERFGVRWNKDDGSYYAWIGGHEYIDPAHEPMMEGFQPIEWEAFQLGDSLLVAAMRCVVEKELGDNVAIPAQLA